MNLAALATTMNYAPVWLHDALKSAERIDRLWADIRHATLATNADMERLRATGANPYWAFEHICQGRTIDEVIAMVNQIKLPSTKSSDNGNAVVVIPDDPEVTGTGTRESSLLMRYLQSVALLGEMHREQPTIGHPKRDKARAKMARQSRKRNRP